MQIIYGEVLPFPLQPSSRLGVALNGLPLTGRDPDGVVWSVKKPLTGWSGRTGSTGEATQRAYQDGAWLGPAHSAARTLVVRGDLRVSAKDGPAGHRRLIDALDQLMGAIPVDRTAPFVVDEDGLRRHVLARLDGEPSDPVWVNPWMVRYEFQLIAPDYRRFGGDGTGPTHVESTSLPSHTGGLAVPYAVPFAVNAQVVTGELEIVNAGNAPAPVVATISGPVPQPLIWTNDGQAMRFDLELLAGQWLDVDFDRRTILLDGQASRRGSLRGNWIRLAPGSTTLRFDAAAYNSQARMTASWSDSWK